MINNSRCLEKLKRAQKNRNYTMNNQKHVLDRDRTWRGVFGTANAKKRKKKTQFGRAISPLQMRDVSSHVGADVIEMRFSLYSSRVRVGRIFKEDLTV